VPRVVGNIEAADRVDRIALAASCTGACEESFGDGETVTLTAPWLVTRELAGSSFSAIFTGGGLCCR
jgi:hypothetical protein